MSSSVDSVLSSSSLLSVRQLLGMASLALLKASVAANLVGFEFMAPADVNFTCHHFIEDNGRARIEGGCPGERAERCWKMDFEGSTLTGRFQLVCDRLEDTILLTCFALNWICSGSLFTPCCSRAT